MRGKTVGLVARATDSEPSLGSWDPALVAPLVSTLLAAPVGAEDLRRRAIGLGLLSEPPAGRPCELSARALSRLFLVGYRLPAHVEHGNFESLCRHVRERRLVFVLFPSTAFGHPPRELPLCLGELHDLSAANGLNGMLVSGPYTNGSGPVFLSEAAFSHEWAAAGNLLVVAARGWGELPTEGRQFFAGSREKDGTLHWETAECDTTAAGEIVR